MQFERSLYQDEHTHTVITIDYKGDIEIIRRESSSDDLLLIPASKRSDALKAVCLLLDKDDPARVAVSKPLPPDTENASFIANANFMDVFVTAFRSEEADPLSQISSYLKEHGVKANFSSWSN